MDGSSALDRTRSALAERAPLATPLLRVGVGLVLLLAGAHKLVRPDAWSRYAAPLLVDLWPASVLSFDAFMQLGGVGEVAFGLLLLAGTYTSLVAALSALSLASVVVNLAVGWVQTGDHLDILVRDVGLTAMAAALALLAARAEEDARRRQG